MFILIVIVSLSSVSVTNFPFLECCLVNVTKYVATW